MSTMFRPYQPDQLLLLSPDVGEWLPDGHLAYHVGDMVDGLDLTAFYRPYEGDGRPRQRQDRNGRVPAVTRRWRSTV